MIEALLSLLFNHIDIINHRNNAEGELYLRRWFIWPRKPADLKMVSRIYLHKFYTGDSDRHLHDHPWPFTSVILKGGYTEYRFNPAWKKWEAQGAWDSDAEPPQIISTWYGPGSVLRRGAAWAHSVMLKTNKDGSTRHAWSLVFTGIKCRSWGFHTEDGWCWWRNYTEGACVCYDNPNEVLQK